MRWFKLVVAALLILIGVLAFNTARLPPLPVVKASLAPAVIDEAVIAERLSSAVRIQTVSYDDRSRIDAGALDAFANLLQTSFPQAHAKLQREVINGHSLLYTWPGLDPNAKPALFLAHMDVVPIEPGTEAVWTQPPFSGAIAEGFIWGRGAIDDKASVMGWMEAIEAMAARGWQPRRTLYFAFGHDEEIGGKEGAAKIADVLKQRGVKAEFLLDEGGVITQGLIAGITQPVATIMAAEKGYASFRLTARAAGGHSSYPPKDTAVSSLARAIVRLQDQPMPARLAPPVSDMLLRLAPAMPLMQRVAIANRWLFNALLIKSLSKTAVTSALLRTTTAPTLLRAGIKDNVLPSEAWAVVNFRLLPGDTVAALEAHIRKAVGDEHIELAREGVFGSEASAVSASDSPAFARLERTVNEVFPEALVTTGLVIGGTDARHYEGLYEQRYNFVPTPLKSDDLPRIHGSNERIGVKAYADIVRFYQRLLENLDPAVE